MGNNLLKRFHGHKEVRILFLGLFESGKTTTLYRLALGDVVTTIPTIGFNVETVQHNNVELSVFDVGGRNKIRPLLRHYYQNTQGLVFMIDSTDRDRFDFAINELIQTATEEELEGVPILILANKQDIAGAMTPTAMYHRLYDVKQLKNKSWVVFGVNATHNDQNKTGLREAFDWLTKTMLTKENYHVMKQWLPKIGETGTKELKKDTECVDHNKNENSRVGCFLQSLKSKLYRVSK